uniref:Ubiquitin-like domain-containing protein n=1 Tax=Oncorhynchus tshawytscha TaxID=74940 RepID=A0A8C8C890_ONCTS
MATAQLQWPMALPVRLHDCPRGDPPIPVPYDPTFLNATHASLLVVQDHKPNRASRVAVTVLSGSDGKRVPFVLKSTDTIGKLQRRFLQKRPDLTGSLNLAYNGKPVQRHQSLGELGVKNGATFITFLRCLGG